MVKSWLQKPFPATFELRPNAIRALLFGAFVFAFLWYFQPFGMHQVSDEHMFFIALHFGLITIGCIIVTNVTLPWLLGDKIREEHWTTGKEILMTALNFLVIGTANVFYLKGSGLSDTSFWDLFFYLQGATFAIGIIPVVFFVYVDQARFLKKHLAKAQEADAGLVQEAGAPPQSEENILFANEAGKTELQLPPADVLYIRSDGNYLEIFFRESGQTKKHLLRNRIKEVAELLPSPPFVQCHRSYIVNLSKVRKVSGNARGYELSLADSAGVVPVSRSKAEQVLQQLKNN